ncbi:unnamed protein product [Ceutorhynchus assimilis]|uniref:Uncharacterized protein n=1 Tax=Ceutorhynchus assimilis TaxID=467358 RepID=A0A9N9MYP0_9CUCU|nr:unnamed protein product [Ceutorhynchus assimilis]
MLLKYTVIFLVIVVAVKSATIQERNIPVEIRYERLEHDITGNLREKVQLSEEELKENQLRLQKFEEAKIAVSKAEETKDHSHLIQNLNEKVQLSPEDLLQSSKHIPIQHTLDQETENLEKLGDSSSTNKISLIDKAQDLIENGLKTLKANFVPTENQVAPPKELWEKLEKDVKDFFTEERNKFGSRQNQGANQQNIFQNFANGFQQMTNNFVQQFQGLNQNGQNGTSGDEGTAQQQGPIQGFIGYFTGGVQNIVSNIQNLGQNGQQTSGNSTVLGDSGTNQGQPGNIIGNFVNGVQQFFQGPQQGINQIFSSNNTQGDTGTGQPGSTQQGFFAGAINQFNSVVSNIIPTTAKPGTQGDEGTASTGGTQNGPIQQVIQSFGNIGNAFNQFIQGGQQNKPPGSEDENANPAPPQNQNFIQSIGQNIGNAFQTIQNQFRPPSPSNLTAIAGSSDGANAIVGQAVNAGTQIQQVAGEVAGNNPIQNLIPGSSPSESGAKKPVETATPQPASPAAEPVSLEAVPVKVEAVPDKKEVMTATE